MPVYLYSLEHVWSSHTHMFQLHPPEDLRAALNATWWSNLLIQRFIFTVHFTSTETGQKSGMYPLYRAYSLGFVTI